MANIYVASSWRNSFQLHVVSLLRMAGHEVYDFRNPKPHIPAILAILEDHGFHWSEIDPDWQNWTKDQFRKALNHLIVVAGFKNDMEALLWCDTLVLVLPCGRSAHTEAGWATGRGKKVFVYIPEKNTEPELMYSMFDRVCINPKELLVSCER